MAETAAQEYISENDMASRLSLLGMITGNEKGDFMLQSKLKRSEATQFLVNLIGKNKYVKDNKDTYSTTNFNDVKKTDWFAPVVGYCERTGIIAGMEPGKFDPKGYVTEKQFLAMTLKALGYTTDDFSWSTVFQKAYEVGLVSDSSYQTKTVDNSDFKRGNVVRVMYTALGLKPKSENMSLIQKMVNEDQITYETASASKIFKDEVVSKILEVKPLNEQKIKVTFNERIGVVVPANIQINDSGNGNALKINSIEQKDSELIIKTSNQKASAKYIIEIKKLVDSEGNTISKVIAEFNGFAVVETKSDLFKISKIEQKSQSEVNVYFTHPVNDNAANPSYYEVYEEASVFASSNPTDISVKVLPDNKGVAIGLRNKKFSADKEYSISVSTDVVSAYGVKFDAQTELNTFIAKDIQQAATGFAVEQIAGLTRNTIQVDFTMNIDPDMAEQNPLYYVTDSNGKYIEIKGAKMVSKPGKSVLITLNTSLDSSKTYNLMVNLMGDATGQYTIKTKGYSFTGEVSGGAEFQIYAVVPADTSAINVAFSKPVSDKALADLSNFTIQNTKNPAYKVNPIKAVVSPEDSCTVILFLPNDKKLQSDVEYTLKLTSKITDFTGRSLTGQSDYTFDTYNISEASMSVEKAVKISQDTIKIVFSREIAMDKPNMDPGNYSVDYYENGTPVKKVPIAFTSIDSKVLVLKFDSLPDGIDFTFSCKQIKDVGGEIYSDPQKNTVKVTIAK
jgi:hypothetical protein